MSMQAALNERPAKSRDREVIRVNFACDSMGIADALRHAFTEAANDHSDHDFEELLRELN